MSIDIWFAEGGTVYDQNRLTVAHVVGQDEDNSDAVLIAAAPRVTAALRALLEWAREHTSPTDPNSPHQLLIEAHEALTEAGPHAAQAALAKADL